MANEQPQWRQRPRRRDVVRVVAKIATPFAVALAVTLIAGLPPEGALLAFAGATAAVAVLVWWHLADLVSLRRAVDDLSRDTGFSAELPASAPAAELADALRRLRRDWDRQGAAARRQLAIDENIIDNLPDPLIMLDDQARVRRANAAARSLLGANLRGRDLAAVLRHPRVLDAVQETLDGGEGREVEFTLPDVVDRSFNARTKNLAAGPREGPAVVLTLHDLTEVKRSDQMRADFVANASHELRTPLSSLIGFIETLRGPAADDTAARERFLLIMQEQAERMSRLIRDLLSLSRIEMNEHTRPTARVDMAAIAQRALDSLELNAAAAGVTVEAELPAGPVWVTGDADQLEQVVQNLLDNAIKYGRRASAVTLALRLSDRGPGVLRRTAVGRKVVAVAIHNEGEGIAPEHLPRLTERFYRVDPGRSRELGGTGLGLAIVKHIVNRHRGALTIESTPGRGSTFTIHLIAAEAPPSAVPHGSGENGLRAAAP